MTPAAFGLSGGRPVSLQTSYGPTSRSAADRDNALGRTSSQEIYYTVARLLQTLDVIRLPDGDVVEAVVSERQTQTPMLSSADGCRVELKKRNRVS